MMLFSETETAKQNQKNPFHFFFRFAVEGWGEETREKCKETFWFLHTRVRERVRGAFLCFTMQSERTERFRATTHAGRAISRSQDYQQNTFELCLIHTASENRGRASVFDEGRLRGLCWGELLSFNLLYYCHDTS